MPPKLVTCGFKVKGFGLQRLRGRSWGALLQQVYSSTGFRVALASVALNLQAPQP